MAILPGILVEPGRRDAWQTRLTAGLQWLGPDAVLSRHGAARMTFWADCPEEELTFITPHSFRKQKGWAVTRATVPAAMIVRRGRIALTGPAYTAVDLAGDVGGDIIDRALRSRQATLGQMWDAYAAMPGRVGNLERQRLLHDSRDKPWSELERAGHRLLRKHRFTGWSTNTWTPTADGSYFVDVLFERQRLIVEFDGYEYHSDATTFANDRRRRNQLVLAGYTVLNFTWSQVVDDPGWVAACIRRAIGM